jgi:hypothetical protein
MACCRVISLGLRVVRTADAVDDIRGRDERAQWIRDDPSAPLDILPGQGPGNAVCQRVRAGFLLAGEHDILTARHGLKGRFRLDQTIAVPGGNDMLP